MSWEMLGSIALMLPSVIATGLRSTCHAPPARIGETGTVTCIFPVTLASVPPVIVSMEHYPPNSGTLNDVLEIILAEKGAQPDINIYIDGYSDVDVQGKEIGVQIPRVSEEHLGRYVCQMMSNNLNGTVHPEPCTLRLNNKRGLKSTCHAPPARRGETGTVTCIFPLELASVSSVIVSMEHYPLNSSTPDNVFEIITAEKGAQPGINIYTDDYKLNRDVDVQGKEISVQIARVSEEHLGRYVCQMMSNNLQETVQPEPCTLRFKNERAPIVGPEDSDEQIPPKRDIAPTVIIVIIVVILIIASFSFVVFLRRRGRLRCKKGRCLGLKSAEEGRLMETSTSTPAQQGSAIGSSARDRAQGTSAAEVIPEGKVKEAKKQLAEHVARKSGPRGGGVEATPLLNTTSDSHNINSGTASETEKQSDFVTQPSEDELPGVVTQPSEDELPGLVTQPSEDKLPGLVTQPSEDKLPGLVTQPSEDKLPGLVTQPSEDTSSDSETKPHQNITSCPSHETEIPTDKNVSVGGQTASTPSDFGDADDLGERLQDTDDPSPAAKTGTNLSTNSADNIRQEEADPLLDDTENHTAREDEANEDSSVDPPAGKPISAAEVDVTLPGGSEDTDAMEEFQMPASSPSDHGSDSDSDNDSDHFQDAADATRGA